MTETVRPQIFYSHYVLKARAQIGAHAAKLERDGCLLRIEDNGAIGFADLHPWPELGDLDLKEQMKELICGRTTALSARSLELARIDMESRSQEVNAFGKLEIPQSHYLVSSFESLAIDQLEQIKFEGFTHLKIKLGRDLDADLKKIDSLAFSLQKFKLRFDFNATLDATKYRKFISSLHSDVLQVIQFVEEPTPWNPEEWLELFLATHTPLALDRMSEEVAPSVTSPFSWLIVKPAIQSPQQMLKVASQAGARIAITSYLDHPVGQMGAALEAAKLHAETPERIGVCGLLSHVAYEKSVYSEALSTEGPRLFAADGLGIGFDDLLMREHWKLLGT